MAGIGFELKKILRKQTFLSEFTAYLYAAMVSSGPWLMAIICLAVLGVYRGSGLVGVREHEIFRATVIYTYAFSLIFVGLVQLVVTRYLADKFYEKETRMTLATFLTCTILLFVFGTVLSALFYGYFEISLVHKFSAVVLFLVVDMIWLSMIFLSAVKDYNSIVYAFAGGSVLSIFAAMQLGKLVGSEGYVVGYTLGQALIFFWLLGRLLKEFPAGGLWDSDFMAYFKKFWDLMCIGFAFNLAIWVDKIVFWLAPDSRMIVPWFRTNDLYEGPVFFAYITIVPTLALFLLKIETVFYEHYRSYYGKVIGKWDMANILKEKDLMIRALKESLREVLIIQGATTLLCLFFAPELVKMAKMTPLQVPVFRIALIGSFLQVLLALNIIILFYFDLRKTVLAVTMVFIVSNAGLSYITTLLGVQFYGYGFTYACLVSLLFSFYLLNGKVRDLEYITFAGQPVL